MSATHRFLKLRELSVVATVLLGLFVLVPVLAIIWAARDVPNSTRKVEANIEVLILSSSIERTLREHQRVSNLALSSASPELQTDRRLLQVELEQMLREIKAGVDDTRVPLVEQLSDGFEEYLTVQERLGEQGLTLEEISLQMRLPFERLLVESALLRDFNKALLQESLRETERTLWLAAVLVASPTTLLIVTLVLLVFGVQWIVLNPIMQLEDSMQRFRVGEMKARAQEGGAVELQDLSSTFNEMADTITRQHEAQLAFLAGVAHDLRGPISVLSTAAHVLEDDPSQMSHDRLRMVNRQIERLTRMVEDLLDATRIEAGQLELQLENVDLRVPARAMLEHSAATSTSHELFMKAPDRPVIVRADSFRIEQVVGNLLNNAIKYSPAGGPVELSISTDETEAELAVSDRGIGISTDEIPDIFLPFRRNKISREIAPGVGLGLSIVSRIVRAHGGRVEVESKPGVGSTFRVRLPLALP